jgi:hypothetical protein
MISQISIVAGLGAVVFGLWSSGSKGGALWGFLAPVGWALFAFGLIRWLIPDFFPF